MFDNSQDDEIEYKLPVGMKEFEEFASRIISKAGRYADEDSMKFAIATSILHADAAKGSLPDSFFLNRLRKAAANQVASQVFQDIKARQQAAAEAAAKQAEDTAPTEAVSDGTEKN
jgi:hypothetical protein